MLLWLAKNNYFNYIPQRSIISAATEAEKILVYNQKILVYNQKQSLSTINKIIQAQYRL